jgi:indolepyruvate ferredoxin oxidoreductase beta subunit
MVASELLEAGRAAQNGFITPDRTTVITSTHRFFAVAEKSAMGDGRFDADSVVRAVDEMSHAAILADLNELAASAKTVVSSVLLGAVAASGVLPLPVYALESSIRRSGIAIDANLRGFALGQGLHVGEAERASSVDVAAPQVPVKEETPTPPAVLEGAVPEGFDWLRGEGRQLIVQAVARLRSYQSSTYARRFIDLLEPIATAERDADPDQLTDGASSGELTESMARHLAQWMSYEDIVRVAQLKTQPGRTDRIRSEVRASVDQPLVVTEYLKPGLEEWCALLPTFVARPMIRLAESAGLSDRLSFGLHVKTSAVSGFLLLWLLARLRWWRPLGYRWREEQRRIKDWVHLVGEEQRRDPHLALALSRVPRLLKGYGDTHRRGRRNFDAIMTHMDRIRSQDSPGNLIAELCELALADPAGEPLRKRLEQLQA